ncbi:metalloprotease [Plectosphaerella plurivora]|uniref:Metalloprotease n=1 Tax=Plectosphaerella plurivora TaxID=936078 RepID=A0A9P8V6H5_9PEZI|nr:metalloprotease [Plectosphaerella plurivora]
MLRLQALVLILLAATHALAAVARSSFGCATPPPTSQNLDMSRVLAAKEKASRIDFNSKTVFSPKIIIKFYLHVVASSTKPADGYINNQMLGKQVDVLKADFAPMNIEFKLVNISRTVNPRWARDGDEMGMKKALRKGLYHDLNIYILPKLTMDSLGYATFPTIVAPRGSAAFIRDGVNVNTQTLPGGSYTRFNLGRTLTHEVGHWLGLYHTFEGGCSDVGDMVSDTPAQASYSSGCPKGRDSCPKMAGKDPINNYMDYSDDACYTGFSTGQRVRMAGFWHNWRLKS